MRYSTVIATALTATAAVVAAPLEKRAYTTSWVVDTVTSYTTIYVSPAAATPSPIGGLQQSGSFHPPSSVSVPVVPTTTSTPPPPAPTTSSVEPAPVPTEPSAPGSCNAYNPNPDFDTPTISCGVSIIDTVNKWRVAYGKPELVWASNLAKAAWNTVSSNGGGPKMVHPGLIDGAYGETITPGFWDTATLSSPSATQGESPFEIALMGWLCEVKSDKQLQASGFTGKSQCDIVSQTTFISGSANPQEPTGHHDIFIDASYKSIACMYMESASSGQPSQWAGQWACDFGY